VGGLPLLPFCYHEPAASFRYTPSSARILLRAYRARHLFFAVRAPKIKSARVCAEPVEQRFNRAVLDGD
jgi:hypothetical protein